jgi:hypothetical protein
MDPEVHEGSIDGAVANCDADATWGIGRTLTPRIPSRAA